MNLLTLNDQNEVQINQPWIVLVPELRALFKTKAASYQYSVQKNPRGHKLLKYVYFMLDFSSPLRDWNEQDRKKEALRYCDLTTEDVDKNPELKEAMKYYEFLQVECCRPLKTYRATLKAMESMDSYLEKVDFTAVDKQGKLLYTPSQYVDTMTKINKAYDEMAKLKQRVNTELTENAGIRGKATMSDREIKYASTKAGINQDSWDENPGGSIPEGPNMVDIFTETPKD